MYLRGKVGSRPSTSIPRAPPRPASPEPSVKVTLKTRSTSIPRPAAVRASSTEARMRAPKRVLVTRSARPEASAKTMAMRNKR